jgi:hypothetical protein
MKCIGCGCTDERACMTPAGPCHWVSEDPPICSACFESSAGDDRACPVAKSGLHQPLFRSDGSGYCVHCKAELDVPEAA